MSKAPARLLRDYWSLVVEAALPAPVLDLASGDGGNGIFLAQKGLEVTCADRSQEALERARKRAAAQQVHIETWQVDLEKAGFNPLQEDAYGAMLVFHYLHRPLIPFIKKALTQRGILFYETFTLGQPRFGKPCNPDYLLKPGELLGWFRDWVIIHYFEGVRQKPQRAVAQIICQRSFSCLYQ